MNKNFLKLFTAVVLAIIGVSTFVMSIINDWPFGVGGLGIALAGISIEMYVKSIKDTTTEKGKKRSEIEAYDERNVWINAKSGTTVNYVMDVLTLIAFVLAVYLHISLTGQILLLSLILLRMFITPIVKRIYQSQL